MGERVKTRRKTQWNAEEYCRKSRGFSLCIKWQDAARGCWSAGWKWFVTKNTKNALALSGAAWHAHYRASADTYATARAAMKAADRALKEWKNERTTK
jgi:hypothetical protein